MNLRADHIAGAAFVGLGVLIFALSGDLPFGTLSFPGSGFMPKLVAALLIIFGIILTLRATESARLSDLPWSDLKHGTLVILIPAIHEPTAAMHRAAPARPFFAMA